jgi:hypothetical protein
MHKTKVFTENVFLKYFETQPTLEGKFWFPTGLCDCFLVAGDIYN